MRTPRRGITYGALAVVFILIVYVLIHGTQGSTAQSRDSGALAQAAMNFKNHSSDGANTLSSAASQEAVINGDGTAVTWYAANGTPYQTTVGSSAEAIKIFTDNGYANFRNDSSSGSNFLLSILLPNLVLFGLMALFLLWIFRQTQSGNNQAMSFGRSRARLLTGDKPAITFADVAGVEEAKQELSEIVEFLKFPDKFTAVGARIPKGVLLVGPPGTGKTLISKAVAGEAGVPFFSISGSE